MGGKNGFSDIYHAFKKGINLILIITIFAVGAMGILNEFVIDPVYQSTVQILINSNDATSGETDTNDTQTSSQLIEACSEIIESPEILDEVVKVLEQKGIHTTVTELQNAITVTSESDNQVMNVIVEGDNPSTTAVIANTTAEVFQTKIVDLIPVENVTILSSASLGELVKPNTLKNTVLAGGIGLLIGIVIVFIRGVRDTTIKKEETLTEMFGVTVLGTITDFELMSENHNKKKKPSRSGV